MSKYDAVMLRCCSTDMTSHNGFRWPRRGPVECPDWDSSPECGGGLHGLPWGQGEAGLLDGPLWQAVKYRTSDAVNLKGHIKIPRGFVALTGSREDVTQYIYDRASWGTVINHLSLTAGDDSVVTGGDRATLTGGDRATLTAGNHAVLTGGRGCRLTGGRGCVLTGGNNAVLTGGPGAVVSGGNWCVLTGGDWAVLTGGNWSTLLWRVWTGWHRIHVAYVGEGGIEPGRPYTWRDGRVVEVTQHPSGQPDAGAFEAA